MERRIYSRGHQFGVLAVSALLLVTVGVTAGPTKLPPEFKVCVRDQEDTESCVEDALKGALQLLNSGLPDFGIPPIHPVQIPGLGIGGENGDAPVNLRINFTDIKIYNLGQAIPSNVRLDLDHYKMYAHGHVDTVTAEANYVMDGRILLIPAKGEGRAIMNITNLDVELGVEGEQNIKKNREYLKVTNFPLDLQQLDHLEMKFDNLFNGDKTLGPSVNKLLNENWRDIWAAVKLPLTESLRYTFKEFARRIFDKVAMDDIFLRKTS